MENESLLYTEFGQPSAVVQLVRSNPQPLQADEVRIAISHVSVNPSDLIPITGAYAHRTPLPAVVGYEGVGLIVEVGSSELKELIGQRALPLDGGTWQRYVVSKREQLILVPNSLPDELACQMFINPLTAWVLCMEWMSLSPGKTLLVNAANSAIGKLFLQLAQKKGARLIAVVRHQQAAKELVDLGATDVINSSDEDVSVAVKKITNGTGVDYAIDSIGGEHGTTLATCVKKDGYFFLLGLLSGKQIDWSYVAALPINTKIFHLRHWLDEATYAQKELAFQQLFDLVLSQQLHLYSFARVSSYKSFKMVLQEIENKQVSGKQCLVFD